MKGCISCHSLDGSPNIGPSVKGVYGTRRQFTDGRSRVADDAYIRESILNHGAEIVQGYRNQGPPQKLTEAEIEAIVTLYRALSDQPAH